MSPLALAWVSAWFSVLSSERAACLAAGTGTPPSAGAAAAPRPTTAAGNSYKTCELAGSLIKTPNIPS